MTRQDFYDLAFVSVLSLRFHPKNDESSAGIAEEVKFASSVAMLAVIEREEVLKKELLWPGAR